MSTSRIFTGAVAAFVATHVSIAPGARSATPEPRSPAPRARVVAEVAPQPPPPAIDLALAPPPREMGLEITPDGRGGHSVRVRRRGFLVSLRHEDARSAGEGWTALRIATPPGHGGPAGRLIWETTSLGTLETTRGVVLLTSDGDTVSGALRLAAPPVVARGWQSARATCRGQEDGLGGFTALCRFAPGVRVAGAVNVTGARPLDDAWLAARPSPLVRLDLPRSPGGAEGRVIGMVQGLTAVVLRVEATFAEGDAPELLFEESERVQPAAIGF